MNPLEHALDVGTRMRDALQAELELARQQRVLIRQIDVQGLFERARQRGEFNVRFAQLQDALSGTLTELAAEIGAAQVTIDLLRTSELAEANRLGDRLSELRASAQALQEIDAMNQVLAKRALSCVRGFLSALSPRASVYDRHGGISSQGEPPIARQVA